MSGVRVTMDVGSDGVAVITICNPPVNALATQSNPNDPRVWFVAGLKEKYAEALRRNDVKAIVLTGICSGRTLDFSPAVVSNVSVELLALIGQKTVHKTDGKKPSVAAIQGLALGGGLELTMGCHARIATAETQLGLPELSLGVMPGFGGTQRLPRLVGVSKAVQMMLTSKPIMAKEGKALGLIDAVVSSEELMGVSRRWALDIAERRKPWISSLYRTDRLGSLSEAREVLKVARQQARQTAPNMPQHQACLDVIEEGIVNGGYAGVLKEAKDFKELVLSNTAKGLVHVFFSQRATSKVPKVTDVGLKPQRTQKVAVIGGGLMGSGIATALILSNIQVFLKEVNPEYLQKGVKTIADHNDLPRKLSTYCPTANLRGLVTKGAMTQQKADNAMSRLKGVLDYSEFKNVDMVIEAVVENVPLKQSIFSDLEKTCPAHCILATNTSTIDLNLIGEKTSSQDRIIGAHFFSPAHVMPLLEIVRTEKTSPQVILDLMTVGKTIKKIPVVVGNCTGFAVNRTFFPYTQGAHLLAHLGVDVFRIDRVITNFGMPMGPFLQIGAWTEAHLQDVAGYGVALAVGKEFSAAFPDRTFGSPLVKLLVENGRNGKSNGKGYYIYEKGSKPKPDPSVQAIIEESKRICNIMPSGKSISVTDEEIVEMVFFPVVNEACRVIDEGFVVRASDLDITSVLGMSFPKYRGGIVFWADLIGPAYVYRKLKKWEGLYGSFFKPSRFLEERAKAGIALGAPKPSSPGSKARL
ncbi:hypothetical protein ACLOJK_020277 [Asimina triloba]